MKRIITMALIIVMLFSVNAFALDFETFDTKDLIEQSSTWAKSEIEKADELGLVTKGLGLIYTKDITRGQFAELVVNMAEKATSKTITPADSKTFEDTEDIWVLKAFGSEIVTGVSKTKFEPDTLITREQIATMLYRAITYIEKEKSKEYISKNESLDGYTDKDSVSNWALTATGVLANNEIMKGTSATSLSPKQNASIEQCIILVYRLYEKVK
ncbi:S-layer homology domain-containing protein [Aminipila sp.]|uniref:S-layer homology domain-containing protein n=1 Tax=Aminipila sp. TaxID=2060095 RepID=UPI002898D20F|nr:S-layer homology domain-containing protein [Aminipila sp.]